MEKTNISVKVKKYHLLSGVFAIRKMLTFDVPTDPADKGLMLETLSYLAGRYDSLEGDNKLLVKINPRWEQGSCIWHSCQVAVENSLKMDINKAHTANMMELMNLLAPELDDTISDDEEKPVRPKAPQPLL